MKVTHVLFDLDGLLINSEDIYTEQLIVLLNRLGKVYTHHAKRLIMGRKPIEGAEALRKEYDLPMTASEIATEYSKELPLEIWRKAKLLSGVQRLIEHLHLNSIPMAIATGSEHPQLVYKMWNNKDVWQLIHHVVASGDDPEVKHGKPAPDVFEVALARFHDPLARPETTLVFEDSWNGVRAGLAAGMHVVWVPDSIEAAGFPTDLPELTAEMKSRVLRLKSLEDFDPTLFGLPPYNSDSSDNCGSEE